MSAVYAIFTVLASAFVVSSTYQIAVGVFVPDLHDKPAEPGVADSRPRPKGVTPACAAGVKSLSAAVRRAVMVAAAADDPEGAEQRYLAARSPEWDTGTEGELVGPCAGDAQGAEAVAAVRRLDRAAAGAIRRQSDELGPVRRAVDSFIR
jgi:hypothetical protein